MGRYYKDKKATVEESCDLTVFQLKEYGMLNAGKIPDKYTPLKK